MTQAPYRYVPIHSHSEHVDDMPLLLGFLQRLQIPQLIDHCFLHTFDVPSKNLGTLLAVWISHMLSQSQNQSRHLRSWIAAHPETMRRYVPAITQLNNANDAHLREILSILANDRYWEKVETAFNRHIVHQFKLSGSRIRLEANSSLWYINSDGSLQIDSERRWRSGTNPVHMVLAVLEPSNIPLTLSFVLGNEQNRELALEVVQRTRSCLSEPLLYTGNGALSSQVRAAIIHNQDQYLGMLSQNEIRRDVSSILSGSDNIEPLLLSGEQEHGPIVEAYERRVQLCTPDTQTVEIEERQLYIRRHDALAEQTVVLRERIHMVCQEIMALTQPKRGKRRLMNVEAVLQAAQEICAEYGLDGLIDISCSEDIDARTIRRYRGRPTTTRVNHMLEIIARPNEEAISEHMKGLGWQAYITTLGRQVFSIQDLLEEPLQVTPIVQRLNNLQLSLLPGVIQRLEHTRGMVRLMMLALRCLTLLDHVGLARLSSGDSQSTIWRGEDILKTFLNVTLTTVHDGLHEHRHLTTLSTGQRRILDLLGLPHSLYQLT